MKLSTKSGSKGREGMDPHKIGSILRKLRGEKTLQEVSSGTGLSKQAICNYETGIRIPRDEAKLKIASYYGKTVQEIFFAE